jgi:proteasome lid subunit RPN8/RPN11
MITVGREHVDRTVDVLRSCGGGERECVVYWVAAQSNQCEVRRVDHPDHAASRYSYKVDSRWLNAFFLELADHGEQVIGQVHSHPGSAVGHSEVDDKFVIAPSPGILSIVVPQFAARAAEPATWTVQRLETSGYWVSAPEAVKWP